MDAWTAMAGRYQRSWRSGRSPPRWRGPGTRGRSRQAGFSPRLRRAVACGTWEGEVPDGLLAALEAPGLDLAMELLLGPGSFTHVLTALEDSEE